MDAGKSAGGFLGIGPGGPKISPQLDNSWAGGLATENASLGDVAFRDALNNYQKGGSLDDVYNGALWNQGQLDDLATGSTTGSRFATDQVQNNAVLGGLFGKGGQLDQAEQRLTDLNNQGFELKPEDMTLYGQTAGNIARMFGAQGNQISQDLASRGLASAPSGAAGAMFSGLAGNQQEMLAKAQQDIMQQRFQNTLQQIGQQQNMVAQLGAQGANAINQQYTRQLSGAGYRTGLASGMAGQQNQANAAANNANFNDATFNSDNQTQNFMDFATSGLGQGAQAALGGAFGGKQKTKSDQTNNTTSSQGQQSAMSGAAADMA